MSRSFVFCGAARYAKQTTGAAFRVHLSNYRDQLLHLKSRWSSPLASAVRFDSHVQDALQVALKLTGSPAPDPRWISLTVPDIEAVSPDHTTELDGHEEDGLSANVFEDPALFSHEEDVVIIAEYFQDEDAYDGEGTRSTEYSENEIDFKWMQPVSI